MPEECGSGSAILKAISAGRPRQVRLLVEAGSKLSTVDECGQGALIRAVFIENNRNQIKIAKLLLKNGGIVSQSDIVDRNALHWACIYGKDRLVSYLLAHRDIDLDLNQADMNGCTALFHAASSGSAATVKMIVDALLKYSLSVDVSNFNGITPLMQAMRNGHDVVASILIHQGKASTTVRDREFRNAFDWAENRPKKVVGLQTKQKSHQSFLPNIIPSKVVNMITYRENHAIRQRRCGTSDGDDELDSSCGSDNSGSYPTFEDETQTISDGWRSSQVDSSYQSIQYPSPEPNIENRTEMISSPSIHNADDEKPNLQYQELRKLYKLLEHQLNDSFRPGYYIRPKTYRETTTLHCTENTEGNVCQSECCEKSCGVIFSEESIQRIVQANRKLKKEIDGPKRSNHVDLRKKVGEMSVQRAKATLQAYDTNFCKTSVHHTSVVTEKEETTIIKNTNANSLFPELSKGKVSLVSNLRRQSVDKAREDFERLLNTKVVGSLYE